MDNIKVGKKGEELAKDYLIKNGYKIVEFNKRFSRFCEIDIVCEDIASAKRTVAWVYQQLAVEDTDGNDMVISKYDPQLLIDRFR